MLAVMRLPSVLAVQGRRLRVVLINTIILSVLTLCLSSQWWSNGFPGSSVSPAEYRGPYVYHHEQTLAIVHFQSDGQFRKLTHNKKPILKLTIGFGGSL